tara:strand:+ start:1553 stop:2137 length:585 start_codon:yes stop_codon:yes gene_type:complete
MTTTVDKLQRVTSIYSDNEDRFRIAGEVDADSTRCLWLTQRLLMRLVPHMLEWLNEIARAEGKGDLGQAELMQDFAQQAAKARLEPQAAVRVPSIPDPNAPIETTPGASAFAKIDDTWLVQEVDISKSTNGVLTLVFKRERASGAQLAMAPIELRQWLIILHTQWLQAGWPAAIWPEWVDTSPKASEQPVRGLH